MSLEERLDCRLQALDKRQKWLCKKVGVSSQRVTNWKARDQIPATYLFDVAKLLKCSPEWLAGKEEDTNKIYLSEEEKVLLQKFRALSKPEQERELTYLRGLIAQENAE